MKKFTRTLLVVELKFRDIQLEQQKRFKMKYRNTVVGEYIPDLLAGGKIIVDTKVLDAISIAEVSQMMNYLRIAKLDLGIILNFRYPKLQYRRVVLSD